MTKDRGLDAIDRKIMRHLQHDARATTGQIAKAVGLSTTPCWNRLKRLESDGYIEDYVTIFNQRRLGVPDTVLIEVMLEHHDEDALEAFGKSLTELPEVLEAYLITGQYDYMVMVAVDGTSGYERFLLEKLYRIPGIKHSRTSFALRCLKKVHSVAP